MRRPDHFSTTSALAFAAMRWMTRGNEPADHFFFQQLAADINAGGSGGGNPQFCGFFFGVEFETVEQAEFLNGPQSDARKNSQIGNDGDEAAQAKSGAFGGGDFHSAANYAMRQHIELFDLDE